MSRADVNRRQFLSATGGLLAATGLFNRVWADGRRGDDGRPAVTSPRATSGDGAFEPNWDERLTISVGPKKADLVGHSEKVLQAAVDYVTRFGGGTVRVLPGEYRLDNSVFLSSSVRILGSGDETVIKKNESRVAKIVDDSDWYDQEITLANGHGFEVGEGVCLRTKNPHNGVTDVLKRTLVARSGNRFKLDKALRKNFWIEGNPTASALFPMITGEEIADVVIEDITLDGNRKNNENLNGNYGGCIFFQDCNRATMRKVTTRNYNGDGMSWQICHDVVVENCHSHDNRDLGLHPGSGSQRPLMRNNRLERNRIGLFFCWGVKYGLAEANHIDGNLDFGISIGHRDTDNLIRENLVQKSGKVGVLFRDDTRGKDFWPNRNRLEKNRIVDSGSESGIAVDIQGKTREVTLDGNDIQETRQPMQRAGVRIGKQATKISLESNRIEGFSEAVVDERS